LEHIGSSHGKREGIDTMKRHKSSILPGSASDCPNVTNFCDCSGKPAELSCPVFPLLLPAGAASYHYSKAFSGRIDDGLSQTGVRKSSSLRRGSTGTLKLGGVTRPRITHKLTRLTGSLADVRRSRLFVYDLATIH
jgi:hypothetical protein